jgi:hypothetical protein
MKEKPKEFYSVTLKLPLRPLYGVTVTRRKMQLLTSEHGLLCGMLKCLVWLNEGQDYRAIFLRGSHSNG